MPCRRRGATARNSKGEILQFSMVVMWFPESGSSVFKV
jgi:hypothetical protein